MLWFPTGMNHTNQRNTQRNTHMIICGRSAFTDCKMLRCIVYWRTIGAKYHITRQSAQTPAFTSKHGLLLSIVKCGGFCLSAPHFTDRAV